MIGPTREVYIVHQYAGPPLYKQSNVTSSGLERDPNAEFAENIRSLSSTGCGMVHFQREKDALEAWEQYNGKLLDGNRKVLRVQIVVDADESWLNPAERPSDSSPLPQDDTMMDTEPIEAPSANLRVTEPKSELVTSSRGPSKATMSKTTGHVTSSRTQPMAPVSTVKQTNVKPSSKSVSALPLLDRIGSPAAATSDLKNRGSITLGGHSIFLDGSATGYSAVQTIPVHASGLPSKGRVKKGPRRLAKLEAHRQQRFDQPNLPSVYPMQPITNVGQPVRPRAADLDAEMEEYRRSGLMGLGPGR
ncbi:hypothetical protein M408DRAFT_329917 [Serendipita vermifera MAFF 305830]|uniref:RRM domain-containing protein n=1 Tax=Serendipita vermifera MAFF 305830 TaxID=933852 RepID=A0A0C3AT68_SERVB|nr:hypothetical protein M408DRAFT_329917 [Serendipita vermifera MAFF 305830]